MTEWEPSKALYLEDNFYHNWFGKFFIQIQHSLVTGGVFVMEGHEKHLKELEKIAIDIDEFSSVKIKNDYNSRNRFLILRK